MPKLNTDAAAKAGPAKQVQKREPPGDAEALGLVLGWKCTKCGTILQGPGNSVIRPCPKCGGGEFVRIGALRDLLPAGAPSEAAPRVVPATAPLTELAPLGASATNAETSVSTDGLPFVGPTTAPIAVDDEDLDDE